MHNFQMQRIWFPDILTKYLGLFRIAIDEAIYKNRTLNRVKSIDQFCTISKWTSKLQNSESKSMGEAKVYVLILKNKQ